MMTPIGSPGDYEVKTPLPAVFIYSDCTCRSAAELMATEGIASLPAVDRKTERIDGTITLRDLLRGRNKAVVRESERLRLADNFRTNDFEDVLSETD
jgi:CBS-domain-containing membrane protein